MKIRKIQRLSPDKFRGKYVRYRKGDCLAFLYPDGNYLAAIISEKFNAYYDLTLLEFYKSEVPSMDNFYDGQFFGTRFGSWDDLSYAVDKRMIKCSYIDNANSISKIGSLTLINDLQKAGYSYLDNELDLLKYFLEELPIRLEKTRNAEKYPDLAFVSKHLIHMNYIIDR